MSTTRKPLGKRLRFEIFDRDGFQCQYCGRQPPDVCLNVDHIIPVLEGGSNDPANLTTSCSECNSGKGARMLTNGTGSERDRLRRAQEHMESIDLAKVAKKALRARNSLRSLATELVCETCYVDECEKKTVTLVVNGMREFGPERVMEWIDRAASKVGAERGVSEYNLIRYFCGILRRVREEEQCSA